MSSVQPSPVAMPTSRRSAPARRVAAVTVLFALLVAALTGCLRVQVSMGVSSNDRVSGRIVAAVVPTNPDDKGPELKAPDQLAAKVRVETYNQDGFVGTQVFFDDLTFGEVGQLGGMSEQTQGLFDLEFKRSGDLVSLTGRVDLESVPPNGSDVQFSIAFPSRVAKTNGTREGDNTVSWKLPAGEVSTLRAEVMYADPNTRSFAGWAGIVGGITLAVAAVVAGLAFRDRNPASPNAPRGFSPREMWREISSRRLGR
ncbi:LppM family (lipo)protein [Nocardia rhizosphaerae]|uniref:LppM family (Lipo)protein n=1 Tax=Nocardia rhizosphaerae TaxID=1691571 RepID=A0ABV8KZ84_9NOCA